MTRPLAKPAGADGDKAVEARVREISMAEDLLAIGRSRDLEAFKRLFESYAPKVKSYMMRRGAENALAEDLTQETFVTIWRRANQFDPARGSPAAWIYVIARNISVDAIRRDYSFMAAKIACAFDERHFPRPDQELETGDESRQLKAAIAGLPPHQVEALRFGVRPSLTC